MSGIVVPVDRRSSRSLERLTDKTVRAKARTGWVVGVLSLSGVVVALQQTLVVPVLPAFATASGVSSSTASWAGDLDVADRCRRDPSHRQTRRHVRQARDDARLSCRDDRRLHGCGAQPEFLVTDPRALFAGVRDGTSAVGISIMRDVLPPEKLSGAVALMSATLGIGGMFGMPMAGVISAHWGLPALFWVTGGFGGSTDSRLAAGGAGIGCEESRTLRLSGGHGPHTRYDCTAAGRFERNRMGLGKPRGSGSDRVRRGLALWMDSVGTAHAGTAGRSADFPSRSDSGFERLRSITRFCHVHQRLGGNAGTSVAPGVGGRSRTLGCRSRIGDDAGRSSDDRIGAGVRRR